MSNEVRQESRVNLGGTPFAFRRIDVRHAGRDARVDAANTANDLARQTLYSYNPNNPLIRLGRRIGIVPSPTRPVELGNVFTLPLDTSSSFFVYDQSETENEKPVGCLITYTTDSEIEPDEQVLRVRYWGVLSKYRRRGIGGMLFSLGLAEAERRNLAVEGVALKHSSGSLARSARGQQFIDEHGYDLSIHPYAPGIDLMRLTSQ